MPPWCMAEALMCAAAWSAQPIYSTWATAAPCAASPLKLSSSCILHDVIMTAQSVQRDDATDYENVHRGYDMMIVESRLSSVLAVSRLRFDAVFIFVFMFLVRFAVGRCRFGACSQCTMLSSLADPPGPRRFRDLID